MSVALTTTRQSFVGDGSTTSFTTAGFEFKTNSQLKVKRWTTASSSRQAVSALTLGVDYTLTGSPATAVVMASAPTAAQTLEIYRDTSLVQAMDLSNVGAFNADNLETAGLDLLLMMLQEANQKITDLTTRIVAGGL